jgi:hypothetical protein
MMARAEEARGDSDSDSDSDSEATGGTLEGCYTMNE